MVTQFDVNATISALESEGAIPDLSDVGEEASQGAWKAGWYPAKVLDGYATRKGTQFQTQDILAKNGDSRNLRLCFGVSSLDGKETRNIQSQLNYRAEDLTAERITAIKEARVEFKGQQKWPGSAGDLQRSSLALGKLGQLQKAIGFTFKSTNVGIDPSPFVSHPVDVRLATDERGFNEIKEFALAGTKTGKK